MKTIKLLDVKDLTNDELNKLNKITEEEITKRKNIFPEVHYCDDNTPVIKLGRYKMFPNGECTLFDDEGHKVIINIKEMWDFFSYRKEKNNEIKEWVFS